MCEPNGIELAKARELFFQLLFFHFIGKVADINSCAAFAAHVAVCLKLKKLFSACDSRRRRRRRLNAMFDGFIETVNL